MAKHTGLGISEIIEKKRDRDRVLSEAMSLEI